MRLSVTYLNQIGEFQVLMKNCVSKYKADGSQGKTPKVDL